MSERESQNFIEEIIEDDIKSGQIQGGIVTRFPPEPNGYLHIGHAKAISIDFGMAKKYGGRCNLRMDDTNPSKEDQEYIDSIIRDVKWLGWDWGNHFYFASDYFGKMHELAIELIKAGKAYVDHLTADQIREYRGTLTKPGKNSPYRDRTVKENLELFDKMTRGEYKDGECVLRAKIDMSSPNMNMRDPVMYRVLHAVHHRQGNKWNIYPMYDYAHPLEDAIEGITHSLCSLEFEDHRPLYDWVVANCPAGGKPKQREFARMNLTYTVMSKRKLLDLVVKKKVNGWDDPRMPTLSGMRRRGYTPEAIRDFCERIGVAKSNSIVDFALLENCVREDLNKKALRRMAVIKPLKVIIDNYPEGKEEWIEADNNPEDPSTGTRKIPFTREIWIEQDDFMENPAKGYFRLFPGAEVRLKHAYYIKCESFKKDAAGNITELHCSYDPATTGGDSPDGRKVKGTLHWVSVAHAKEAEVRIYDHLFMKPEPERVEEGHDFHENLNPDSLTILTGCKLEPVLADAKAEDCYQFLRLGYFIMDADSKPGHPVFNRTATLRDTWAKQAVKA